jgi:hypothetical protein
MFLLRTTLGCVANSERRRERSDRVIAGSSSESLELLSERRLPIAGILRLSFAHHVDHLDPAQNCPSGRHRLEPEHRSNPPSDGAMILFDTMIQIRTLPDPDRLQFAPRLILELAFRTAG